MCEYYLLISLSYPLKDYWYVIVLFTACFCCPPGGQKQNIYSENMQTKIKRTKIFINFQYLGKKVSECFPYLAAFSHFAAFASFCFYLCLRNTIKWPLLSILLTSAHSGINYKISLWHSVKLKYKVVEKCTCNPRIVPKYLSKYKR